MRASPWRRLPGRVRGKTGIPRELARSFAFGSLAISLVLWLMLGVLTALLMGPKAADS